MSAATAGLKRLHELHIRLQDINKQLEHGPRQVKARQQILAKKQAEVDALKAELKQTRMLADQKNLQLKTNESKIEQLRGKLNQATSNREFDIIKSQIDADTMANSVLEDEILEVLEKVDQHQQKIKQIDDDAAQTPADVRRVAQEVETMAPKLRGAGHRAADGTRGSREDPALDCDGDLSPARAGTRRRGAGDGRDISACTACFEILTANYLVELNTGKFLFCRSCGRLLYRPEGD